MNPERSLLVNNFIGCPSATLFYNDKNFSFDEKLIWVVDVDAYMKIAKYMKSVLINKTMINVSLSEGDHLTSVISRNKSLMLSERCYLYNKVDCKNHTLFFNHLCNQCLSMSFEDIKKTIYSPLNSSKLITLLLVAAYTFSKIRLMITPLIPILHKINSLKKIINK